MKKKRIKPRAEVKRAKVVTPVNFYDIPLDAISIREWCPDTEGKLPAEEVHYTSPDTLGFLIEELIAYRKLVWPDAEPINPDAEIGGADEGHDATH